MMTDAALTVMTCRDCEQTSGLDSGDDEAKAEKLRSFLLAHAACHVSYELAIPLQPRGERAGPAVRDDYDNIAAHAAAYRTARAKLAATRGALNDYEAVLRARVALADSLVAAGWTPPRGVTRPLGRDRQLLDQPRGVLEADGSSPPP